MTAFLSLRGGEPDFAYPADVLAKADSLMAASAKLDAAEGGAQRVYALELVSRASTLIDPDSAFALPRRIRLVAEREAYAPARALMILLEAEITENIYRAERWKYDCVEIPDEPLADDMSAWSGRQFKARVETLVREAAKVALTDVSAPTGTFAECLKGNAHSELLTPTVALFVFNRGAVLLKETGNAAGARELYEEALKLTEAPEEAYFAIRCALLESADNEIAKPEDKLLTEFRALYNEYRDCEGARYVLVEAGKRMQMPASPDKEAKRAFMDDVALIDESLKAFPNWYNNGELRLIRERLTRPMIEVAASDMCAPGSELDIRIRQNFTEKATLEIRRLPVNTDSYGKDAVMSAKVVRSITLKPSGKDDFAVESHERVRLTDDGLYLLVASTGNDEDKAARYNVCEVRVVPWIPVKLSGVDNPMAAVVNSADGSPEEGVTVRTARGSSTSYTTRGTTDASGLAKLTFSERSYTNRLRLSSAGRVIDYGYMPMERYEHDKALTSPVYDADVMTSRALYHAGDTVEWAAVVSMAERGATDRTPTTVAAGKRVKAVFYDANNKEIDSLTATTDAYGRVYGAFATKTGALTGDYRIVVSGAKGEGLYGSRYVTVSDFKLATFEVKITRVERDTPVSGAVRLSGEAMTYAGMAVGNAAVAVELTATSPWWWYRDYSKPQKMLGTVEARTDGKGAFTVELPADMLAPGKDYFMIEAEASVTAQGGETRTASRNFTLGKPYALNASTLRTTIDAAKPFKVRIEATTPNEGEKAPAFAVRWTLAKAGAAEKALVSGNAMTGESASIDASGLPAGIYEVSVCPVDEALADKATGAAFTLYNTSTGAMPEGSVLFVPESEAAIDAHGTGEILVGVERDNTTVYVAVCEGSKITSTEVRRLGRGFHRLAVKGSSAPDVESRATVFAVRDCRIYRSDVSLTLPPAASIRLTGESLRDKTTPGGAEHWRIRFAESTGAPLSGAAVATMYNRALSAISPLRWPGAFRKAISYATLNVGGPSATLSEVTRFGRLARQEISPAELYAFLYLNSGAMYARGGMMMKNMATMRFDSAASVESADNDYMLREGETVTGAVEAPGAEADNGGENGREQTFRPSEVLQAFWKPELTTGPDGVIELSFTAPEAIGAWTLQAFAWTPELASAGLTHNAVSAKPVMIAPTLPRFVRQGDEPVLTATVYNNTDDSCSTAVVFDVRDMSGNEVVAERRFELPAIEAGGSAVVRLPLSVPTDASGLVYKVIAEGAGFRDGEQGIIPVLESASTVIESETFYLNPGSDAAYTLTLSPRDNFDYTLQYCQNPVWTVVKALRGGTGEATTAPEIASAIFSNLAAMRIVSDNPGIAEVIRAWKENPTEEALKSMLMKNEELKALVLESTPWVSAAESQSARMSALAEYLDRDEAEKRTDRLFARLSSLKSEGGLKWAEWSDAASYWATESALITFGIARSMGLTSGYDRLIDSYSEAGLRYLDLSRYVRESKGTDLMFAYLHGLYAPEAGTASKEAQALVDRTLSYAVKNLSKLSTVEKGYATLALKAYGRESEALAAARSIEQFGVMSADQGLSFPSVDDIRGYATLIQALKATGASAATLDAMRQWITVRAQATDDLGALNPDYVVAAVMLTGTVWTDTPVSNSVIVDGRALEIPREESATGYFSVRLPSSGGKTMRLSVRPNGVTPSYGSVTGVGKLPATEIKARPGRDLAVEKRIMVRRGGKWVNATGTTIEVGERVRTDLEIKAGRDMEYVTVTDERASGMEPTDQLPGYVFDGGTAFYRENLDASTRLFISRLPKGTYHLSYEQTAVTAGVMACGICTVQSQLAPELNARSGGCRLRVDFAE